VGVIVDREARKRREVEWLMMRADQRQRIKLVESLH
jgi:hypothetical protein